jgi:hypothetical protein
VEYDNIHKLRGLGKFLYRVKCRPKWKNEISIQGGRAQGDGMELLQ